MPEAPPHRSASPPEPRAEDIVDLDWRTVALAAGGVLTLVGLTALVRSVPRTATWCVIAGLLALALHPLVDGIERRLGVKRHVAVAVVLLGFIAAVALLAAILGPRTVQQIRQLPQDMPRVVRQLDDLPLVGDDLRHNNVPERVQTFLQHLPERLGTNTAPIEDAARRVVGGAIAGLATFLLTVAFLLDGDRLLQRAGQLVPSRYRHQASRLGAVFYQVVGRYFAGSLLVAAVAGIAVLIVGITLQVPLTPLLAVWVAVFNLVPQIGGAVGGVPFVLFATTQGLGTGIAAAVFFVLYLQFENHVLTPLIVGEAVDLSPPATMVAALIGVSAAGVPGALVAVPTLGAAKAIYLEVRHPEEAARRAAAKRDPPWRGLVRLVRLRRRSA